MKIHFEADPHVYRDGNGLRYLSVSDVKKRFGPPFRRNHWLTVKTVESLIPAKTEKEWRTYWYDEGRHKLDPEYPEYLKLRLETELPELMRGWDAAYKGVVDYWAYKKEKGLKRGTEQHNLREQAAIAAGTLTSPSSGITLPIRSCGDQSLTDDLSELEPGYAYTELILDYTFPNPVYDPLTKEKVGGVAGQSDVVFLPDTAQILDYKFDEKISDFPISYPNHGPEFWRFPVDAPDTDVLGYSVQTNLYAFFLENAGWEISDIAIQHNEDVIAIDYEPVRMRWLMSYLYYELENGVYEPHKKGL